MTASDHRRPVDGARSKERGSADRRNEAIAAAIEVLARRGARGLTHREIDRHLAWPLGSTSNYFRRRNDIFMAIAARIMALDLGDLAIFDADLEKPGGMSVDMVVEHVVHLIGRAILPAQRSRSLARAEILFECTRNPEVSVAAEAQIAIADSLFRRVFEQLGSADPALSARFMTTIMSSTYVGLSIATHLPDASQVEAVVRSWIAIGLQPAMDPAKIGGRMAAE